MKSPNLYASPKVNMEPWLSVMCVYNGWKNSYCHKDANAKCDFDQMEKRCCI